MVRRVQWMTQAALGALIGEMMMGRRLGRQALGWGALIGLLPQLFEGGLSLFLDTAHVLDVRQAAGHSVLVLALAAWGLVRGFGKLPGFEKIQPRETGLWIGVTWAAHLTVDACTVDGVALAWPISGTRTTLNLLADGDFLVAAPLVAAVIWLAFLPAAKGVKSSGKKKPRGKKSAPPDRRGRIRGWGFGLSAGYLLLAGGLKVWATGGFEADLARRGVRSDRRMVAPLPANLLLWRCVAEQGGEFRVGYRSVFEGRDAPVRWTIYPKGADALVRLPDLRETRTLRTVTGGWWLARPHGKGAWLGDLRHPEDRIWGARKTMVDSRMALAWLILPDRENDRLRTSRPEAGDGADRLRRTGHRIIGQRDQWEANPRLAGVPGSLPELLAVEE